MKVIPLKDRQELVESQRGSARRERLRTLRDVDKALLTATAIRDTRTKDRCVKLLQACILLLEDEHGT